MKKQTKIVVFSVLGAILLLAIVVGLSLLFSSKPSSEKKQNIETIKVEKQADNVFQGAVAPSQEEEEALDPSLGTLATVNVKNGQEVKVGDVLLTYNAKTTDLTSLQYAVKNAELGLANAQSNVASSQDQQNQLQAQYDQALADQKKAKANPKANPADLAQSLSADPQSIKAQIDAQKQSVQQASQAVATAQLGLEEAQANLAQAQNAQTVTVKAKQAGVVVVGDANDKTQPLVRVLSKDTLIKAQVSEFDYSQVQIGSKVKVKTLNLNQTVDGEIIAVSPVPVASTPSAGATASATTMAYYSFTVKPSKNLQYGYNVQVSIPNLDLLIPTSAVKDDFVQLKQADGSFKAVKVTTQAQSGQLKVLSGLKVGDEIAKNGKAYD